MSIIKDFSNSMADTLVHVTSVVTADANSASVDMQQYNNVAFLCAVGNSGDTLSGSVYIELEMEESDDNSVWTDCADADVKNTVTGTNTGTVAVIDAPAEDSLSVWAEYTGTKRYVRMVINVTGTHTNGTPIGIVALQTNPSELPA